MQNFTLIVDHSVLQSAIAKEFAGWIKDKVEIKSVKDTKDRCPLCGILLDENGVCPKCGYRK